MRLIFDMFVRDDRRTCEASVIIVKTKELKRLFYLNIVVDYQGSLVTFSASCQAPGSAQYATPSVNTWSAA
jgi:hypothetical protein